MDVYIYDAVRTPRGSTRKNGSLKEIEPVELVAQLLQALEERTHSLLEQTEDVVLGCVTQIKDQGSNIAKTAALYAGMPYTVPGITVTRLCTSGLDAVAIAANKVRSGSDDLILAGGVESVSRVPMFADEGAWFANPKISDITKFIHMGLSADLIGTIEHHQRAELDGYAVQSHQRAANATRNAVFSNSLIPVKNKDGTTLLAQDELIRPDTTLQSLATLEPSFEKFITAKQRAMVEEEFEGITAIEHLHHVGNSPSLADGASLIAVGSKAVQAKLGISPIARIIDSTNASDHPMLLIGGQKAAEKLLAKHNLTIEDMDVIEFYEAYASTTLKAINDWQVDSEKFNPNGGVLAMGHALGATGAMMVCTLIDELKRKNGKYGLVVLSGGGGVGTAMIIENL